MRQVVRPAVSFFSGYYCTNKGRNYTIYEKTVTEVGLNSYGGLTGWQMNYNQELGKKLKTLRLSEKLTLSECSEVTGLSVGFLSQIENGKTSIAIDNLQLLADCFGVDMSYFFESDVRKKNVVVVRKWNRKDEKLLKRGYSASLTDEKMNMNMLPKIITLSPGQKASSAEQYVWDGDVFFYVIDGILMLKTGGQTHEMYPSDAAHFDARGGYSFWNASPFVTHVFLAKKKLPEGNEV